MDLVDAFETERRRIERDLHDGVQQRLVALTMTLGRAELDVRRGPGRWPPLQDAHRQAEEALAELRGTDPRHPPAGCWSTTGWRRPCTSWPTAPRCPSTVDIRLPDRLPPPVEQAAYFVVSEALTNVARHARAPGGPACTRGGATTRSC